MEYCGLIMKIFIKGKNYFLSEIINLCEKNGLIIVDCFKDENIISIEEYNDGELGDCIFEFNQVKKDLFKLIYIDKINLQIFKQNKLSFRQIGCW